MPSVSKISDPVFAKLVAEAFMDGCSRKEMGEVFGVHPDTIGIWTKDVRVQTHATRMAQERVNRITRKIDKVMEGRLQDSEKMDTETLLKIRKEYLAQALKIDVTAGKDNPDTIRDAANLLEENPDFAAGLAALLAGGGVSPSLLPAGDPSDDDEIDGD